MKQNNEGDRCARCEDGIAEVPISTDEYTTWICETCDSDLFETDTTFIIQEIDTQIKHHKEEDNETAVRSLEYIKQLLNKEA